MRKGPETSKARNLLGRSGARGKPPGPVCISDDLELPHGLERGAGHPTLPSPRTRRLAFLLWTQLNIFIEAPGMGGLGGKKSMGSICLSPVNGTAPGEEKLSVDALRTN